MVPSQNSGYVSFFNVDSVGTLVDILQSKALYQPDKKAFTFLLDGETEETSLTYQEWDLQAFAIATSLENLGASGERALLIYPPTTHKSGQNTSMIPKQPTYRDRLPPWCIIRHIPNCQQLTVARFSRRPDAESYFKALRHLMPAAPHTIVFVNARSVLDENSVPIPMQLSIES
jgi:acyl-CoA synthetase (AMP-forming)/AMP-acid ligase II